MLIKLPGDTGEFGEFEIRQELPAGHQVKTYPSYTCGHCSRIVIMHPERKRPRKTCLYCMRLVCDTEICDPQRAGCTPLYAFTSDHEPGDGPLARRVRAIMRGATTLAEVETLSQGDTIG